MNKDHVIVEARAEYTKQLNTLLIPLIYETLDNMYEESVQDSKNKKDILINFQRRLKTIPVWNQDVIDRHYKMVLRNCEFISDLIAAIFISNVKILTSIKIGKDKKKIQVTMPKTDQFIHKTFINSAKNVYDDPHMFQKGDKKALAYMAIEKAIDETIRTQLPFQNLLQNYLGKTLNDESESESDSESEASEIQSDPESEDDEKVEPFEESNPFTPEPSTENESDQLPENVFPSAPEPETTPQVSDSVSQPTTNSGFFDKPEEEIKSVPIPQGKPISEAQKQMFFPDAADE